MADRDDIRDVPPYPGQDPERKATPAGDAHDGGADTELLPPSLFTLGSTRGRQHAPGTIVDGRYYAPGCTLASQTVPGPTLTTSTVTTSTGPVTTTAMPRKIARATRSFTAPAGAQDVRRTLFGQTPGYPLFSGTEGARATTDPLNRYDTPLFNLGESYVPYDYAATVPLPTSAPDSVTFTGDLSGAVPKPPGNPFSIHVPVTDHLRGSIPVSVTGGNSDTVVNPVVRPAPRMGTTTVSAPYYLPGPTAGPVLHPGPFQAPVQDTGYVPGPSTGPTPGIFPGMNQHRPGVFTAAPGTITYTVTPSPGSIYTPRVSVLPPVAGAAMPGASGSTPYPVPSYYGVPYPGSTPVGAAGNVQGSALYAADLSTTAIDNAMPWPDTAYPAGHSRQVVKHVRDFKPKSEPLSSYLQFFEQVALVNRWTNLECRTMLGNCLPTHLARVVQDQPPGSSYGQVKAVLLNYENPPNSQPVRIEEFMHRTRDPRNETARAFAQTLRDLAALAYPGVPTMELERQVASRFARGQPRALSRLLMANSYSSIEDAIGAVERLETLPATSGAAHRAEYGLDSDDSEDGVVAFTKREDRRPPTGARKPWTPRKGSRPTAGPRTGRSPQKSSAHLAELGYRMDQLHVDPVPGYNAPYGTSMNVPAPGYSGVPEMDPSVEDELELMAVEAAQVDLEEGTGVEHFFYSVVEKYRPPANAHGKCHFCTSEGHFWMKCPKLRHILAENRLGRKWSHFSDQYGPQGSRQRQPAVQAQRALPPPPGKQAPN